MTGLARPVTAAADHGGQSGRCESADQRDRSDEPWEQCAAPAAGGAPAMAAQPNPPDAATPSPSPGAARPAPAAQDVSPPGAVVEPGAATAETDLRPALVAGTAIAALLGLLLSGFRARRRLLRGWDGSDV